MNEAPGLGSKQTEFCDKDNLMERSDIVVLFSGVILCGVPPV